MRVNKIERSFYITTIILLLHTMRNINTKLYVGILFLSYAVLYLVSVASHLGEGSSEQFRVGFVELVFIFSLLWIPVISLLNMTRSQYFVALPRYLVTLPYIVFCLCYTGWTQDMVKKMLRLVCLFVSVAAISVLYQIAFGPVFFFAEPSYRAGLPRYASLAGSIPSLGSLGAYTLVILLLDENRIFSNTRRWILVFVIITGMMATLSKSAVVNILVCLVIYVLAHTRTYFSLKSCVRATTIVLLVCLAFIFVLRSPLGTYMLGLVEYSFSEATDNVFQDFAARLTLLPQQVMKFHKIGAKQLLFGIGFGALSGTMGLPELPMAHNGYVDLVLSGGIFHLCSYLLLILRAPFIAIWRRAMGLKLNVADKMYLSIVLLIVINMFIGASSFYQPVGAIVIFFVISSYESARILYGRNQSS